MNRNLLIIIIACLLVIVIGIGAFIVFSTGSKNKQSDNTITYDLEEDFQTNISSAKHIIKAHVVLSLNDQKTTQLIDKNIYMIRDKIINIMLNVSEDDLNKQDIQNMLKNKIKNDLQSILEIDTIKEVYFTDFIIR